MVGGVLESLCEFDSNGVCVYCKAPWSKPGYARNCCGEPGCLQVSTVIGHQGGPGTELKKLLAKVGINATEGCSCNSRARRMDENEAREPGWCEAHLDEIVGWLREEASARRLPFVNAAGRMLVRRAIKNAKRAAAS